MTLFGRAVVCLIWLVASLLGVAPTAVSAHALNGPAQMAYGCNAEPNAAEQTYAGVGRGPPCTAIGAFEAPSDDLPSDGVSKPSKVTTFDVGFNYDYTSNNRNVSVARAATSVAGPLATTSQPAQIDSGDLSPFQLGFVAAKSGAARLLAAIDAEI